MLHLPFSYKTGIPIQKLKYQLKDSLALLSGSFLHKGLISKRNPLVGEAKEKGQKNAERIKALMKVIRSKRKYYQNLVPIANSTGPLLLDLNLGNVRGARRNAIAVNRALKKIK
jgi:hypothetical protein